jgi:hypothetical protein
MSLVLAKTVGDKNIPPAETQMHVARRWIVVLALTLIIALVFSLGSLGVVSALQPVVGWTDILAYVWINVTLGAMWWDLKDNTVSSTSRLQLGQSTMGTTIQAGIVASSIFIPLSLAAIQIGYSPKPALFDALAVRSIIIGIVWFGLSTALGLIALTFVNQLTGSDRYVLQERTVGITTNLQLYAIFMGVARLMYVVILVWGHL